MSPQVLALLTVVSVAATASLDGVERTNDPEVVIPELQPIIFPGVIVTLDDDDHETDDDSDDDDDDDDVVGADFGNIKVANSQPDGHATGDHVVVSQQETPAVTAYAVSGVQQTGHGVLYAAVAGPTLYAVQVGGSHLLQVINPGIVVPFPPQPIVSKPITGPLPVPGIILPRPTTDDDDDHDSDEGDEDEEDRFAKVYGVLTGGNFVNLGGPAAIPYAAGYRNLEVALGSRYVMIGDEDRYEIDVERYGDE